MRWPSPDGPRTPYSHLPFPDFSLALRVCSPVDAQRLTQTRMTTPSKFSPDPRSAADANKAAPRMRLRSANKRSQRPPVGTVVVVVVVVVVVGA